MCLPIPPPRQGLSHVTHQICMEATTGFEPVMEVLQTSALPLGYAASTWSGKRDSNPRPPPWQGGALPLSYSRRNGRASRIRTCESRNQNPMPYRLAIALLYKMGRLMGIEPTNAGITIRCVNHFATTARMSGMVEGERFELPNPKERIYSPPRLANFATPPRV